MGRHSNGSSSDEALRRMAKLVSSLLARADCGPFREPVDWRGLELWDYPKVIKKMMDLGTVKRKLERGQYKTAAECAEDIRLVWTNCKTYNADGSDFFLLAESFLKKFEDRYRKIRAEYDTGEDDNKNVPSSSRGSSGSSMWNASGPPSLEMKTQFSSNIFRLNGDELGYVLQVLDLRSPNAVERVGGTATVDRQQQLANDAQQQQNEGADEMEINVDSIDPKTFMELDRYIRDKLYSKEKLNKEMSSGGENFASGNHNIGNRGDAGGNSKKTGMMGNKRKR
mmetsp:Transcript_25112/g.36898  ORF Transcript_25112/g.36898 Transcript_25112/m.36898 type:complete len:282 (+) Transcript_25112:121-966(+)|eukprot:CAMPEP_0195521432 /NCGR_PEP_ID=MMETSP0794_2-20130614/18653_1 /TAXON_ID=515487 /ORGANISM="Stephanopyxis turris, Strain CCMP 815" /LENGTH=281 /DNA_ID=CAMNT_0040650983 /DNA_START=117 /DNA_END=962 /DNA_ORIENTATION=-